MSLLWLLSVWSLWGLLCWPFAFRRTKRYASAPTLTAVDRCDRCSAQAYVRATLHAGGELLFCAHHGREHIPALVGLADIHDESDRLMEPVDGGSTL